MSAMRYAWVLAAWLLVPGNTIGQVSDSVLRIAVTLLDGSKTPTPVPRHALLISDNPATSAPRRVLTRADGTVEVRLRPGSYTVESDRPVAFLGQAYQWTEIVEIVAGREARLELSAANAEVMPLTAASPAVGSAGREPDPLLVAGQWQGSVVGVWSPTARASGFVIDQGGLIATYRNAVGQASSVEVQLSPTTKVAARVAYTDRSNDVAIVWVDPTVVATAPPVPLPCPPSQAPPIDEGQDVVTLVTTLHGGGDLAFGEVTTLHPRAVETDFRLSFGAAGGPVFNQAGSVVGLTSVPPVDESGRPGDVTIVRVGLICQAVAAARSAMSESSPPAPTALPIEPTRPFPVESGKDEARRTPPASGTPVVSSSDFDVAFITPPAVLGARQRADWTGGSTGRPPEAAARLGRLTDFYGWAQYFADVPPVVIVRVTPKLVEGFWKRLAREAARTQGAVLPPLKGFKANFHRMRASCGAAGVMPIHPFVIEHRAEENDVIREGLYVFDPGAFGPHCGQVSLELFSEKSPDRPDTIAIDPKVVERLWQDFAPFRVSGG
jgi:S1-C subfamily serine protease